MSKTNKFFFFFFFVVGLWLAYKIDQGYKRFKYWVKEFRQATKKLRQETDELADILKK